ncbi:MAG: hypothetical protein DRQ54_09620 [Gammaproteobacteria bacterium]|nr:MAG: hypothetical protein DRQ54_09620 [Gammaproteobacteria bacterium]RLA11026.1 MAG: hypothetical protein DRQ52_10370 [Gammaproteobacteria bacterium]
MMFIMLNSRPPHNISPACKLVAFTLFYLLLLFGTLLQAGDIKIRQNPPPCEAALTTPTGQH